MYLCLPSAILIPNILFLGKVSCTILKKILLRFYSRRNLGDDLFIKIFSNYFPDCQIDLIVNLLYIPKGLRHNVKIHPYSILTTFFGKIQCIFSHNNKISLFLDKCLNRGYHRLSRKHDAVVTIGGSIFMDKITSDGSSLPFQASLPPDFSINSHLQGLGNLFVIGANLGPAYTPSYWRRIKQQLLEYNHVSLRDYSSYCMVKELPHVQYAPDVIFLTPQPKTVQEGKSAVISVIDISKYSKDSAIISAYYNLLADAVSYFNKENISVILTSFCKREGDESGVAALLDRIPNKKNISTCFYDGNTEPILKIFSDASFIIGSRFHSVILGILFGKPVFPISYNCKTENYLLDLQFQGKYARLEDLPQITVDDLIYNYEHQILVDCSAHKYYAANQFWGLRQFLLTKK